MKDLKKYLISEAITSNELTPVSKKVDLYKIEFTLWRIFGGTKEGSYDEPMTLRELWTEKSHGILFYKRSTEKTKFIKEKCKKCGSTYIIKDIKSFCEEMGNYIREKRNSPWSGGEYYYKKAGTKTIEIAKEDKRYWRFEGESNWRKLPDLDI